MEINPIQVLPGTWVNPEKKNLVDVAQQQKQPTLLAETLSQARQAICNMSIVDEKRVTALKAAVARDEVEIDIDKLAEAMQQFHSANNSNCSEVSNK